MSDTVQETGSSSTGSTRAEVMVPRISIDWYRSTPWWRLVSQSISISWRTSHILLCAAALLITQIGFNISHRFFIGNSSSSAAYTDSTATQWLHPKTSDVPIAPWVPGVDGLSEVMLGSQQKSDWYRVNSDSFVAVWQRYASVAYEMLDGTALRGGIAFGSFAAGVWNIFWVVGVWGMVGGMLARRSVQELGLKITAPWVETVRWVQGRWLSIVWSVLMPLSLVASIALLPWGIGWISNATWVGGALASILMIPIAFLGLGLGWVCAISLFGFSFSTVAIVTENQADAFDGMSRATAYTFQRPATLFLGVCIAEVLGYFSGSIVSIVLNTGYNVVAQSFHASSAFALQSEGNWLAFIVRGMVPLLIAAYGFSFFWTASSALYLVLRKEIDHAEFDAISMKNNDEPKALPKLAPVPGSEGA